MMEQNGSLAWEVTQLRVELGQERIANMAARLELARVKERLEQLQEALDLLQIERDRAEVARW